ncbi:hypothetical protein BH23CHL2_BH23CHL2_18120 [soil metagenome]
MDLLDRMLGHDQWTTARLLEMSRGLTDAQLDQEFDIGHRTLRATFDHMIFNVGGWTGLMLGESLDIERDSSSVDALVDRHERSYPVFADTARRLVEEQRLDETFIDHHDFPQSYGATILQVIWHNAGHRSEVLHFLQRLGVPDLPDGDPQEWEHLTGRIAETADRFSAGAR